MIILSVSFRQEKYLSVGLFMLRLTGIPVNTRRRWRDTSAGVAAAAAAAAAVAGLNGRMRPGEILHYALRPGATPVPAAAVVAWASGLGRRQTASIASAAAAAAASSSCSDAAQCSAAAGVALAAAAAAGIGVALAPSMYTSTAHPLSGGSCFMPRQERVRTRTCEFVSVTVSVCARGAHACV
jgi:hypothetical protein